MRKGQENIYFKHNPKYFFISDDFLLVLELLVLLCGTRCLSASAVPLIHTLVSAYLIPTPSCTPEQLFMCFVLLFS